MTEEEVLSLNTDGFSRALQQHDVAALFGTTAEFWLNLQSLYELRIAQKKAGKSIERLPTLKRAEEAHA